MKRGSYKNYLKAVGRKPIPPVGQLRTGKQAGELELTPRSSLTQRAVHTH